MNGFIYRVYSPGLYYSAKPCFLDPDALGSKTGFASLYAVSDETRKAIEQVGTTKEFAGCVWSERLWLDVDSYEAAEKVENRLKEMGYDYIAYDTGGRGAHFGIARDTAPSHVLPAQDKAWVKKHFPEPEVDKSLYTHLHLFRIPGTLHGTTGKPKVLVSRQSGKVLVHEPYKPSENRSIATFSNVGAPSGTGSIFDNFSIMSQTGPARNGNRHPTLVRLAYALKAGSIPIDKAYWWLSETNKMFEEPKGEQEIEKIIKDIYADVENP